MYSREISGADFTEKSKALEIIHNNLAGIRIPDEKAYNMLWDKANQLEFILGGTSAYTCMGILMEALEKGTPTQLVIDLANAGGTEQEITALVRGDNVDAEYVATVMREALRQGGVAAQDLTQAMSVLAERARDIPMPGGHSAAARGKRHRHKAKRRGKARKR